MVAATSSCVADTYSTVSLLRMDTAGVEGAEAEAIVQKAVAWVVRRGEVVLGRAARPAFVTIARAQLGSHLTTMTSCPQALVSLKRTEGTATKCNGPIGKNEGKGGSLLSCWGILVI